MDELEISGKRYISTKRAGKDHKYHADYIGQLIRAKKVAGQKVGRAWYVEADSLAAYLGSEAPARDKAASVVQIIETDEASEAVGEEVSVSEEDPLQETILDAAKVVEVDGAAHIPVKIIQPLKKEKNIGSMVEEKVAEKREAASPVFYRTTKEAREAQVTRTGLRYIADEGPLLPPVKKHFSPQVTPKKVYEIKENAWPVAVKIRTVEAQENIQKHIEKSFKSAPLAIPAKRSTAKKSSVGLFALRAGVVLALGAVVFAVAALASTHLLFTETLSGGQSASAGYSVK